MLPLLDESSSDLLDALSRISPIVCLESTWSSSLCPPTYLFFDRDDPLNIEEVVSYLDSGVEKIIVPLAWAKDLIGIVPFDRILLVLDAANFSAVSSTLTQSVSGVLLKTPSIDIDLISSVAQFFSSSSVHILLSSSDTPSVSLLKELGAVGASLVIPTSRMTLSATTSTQINIADAFLATIKSDRPDGLFPTVVASQSGHALGLVYSSTTSITESIVTGKGVYQSRKHGLWRKGETSGATQDIVRIRLDCDSDSLEYRVVQHPPGFCHLERESCFGHVSGLPALERTLQSRYQSAPEGSYTKRLFDDPSLLRSKIMEEADELCSATNPQDVAFEAADLIYFALTKCVASGVSIADIEESLDHKAAKISRRPGNAKPQWVSPPPPPAPKSAETIPAKDAPIRMRHVNLDQLSQVEHSQLLRRPVLNSQEMIEKVRPIVSQVMAKGDAALLELTQKFDKANLDANVIFPPYSEESMALNVAVERSIEQAYSNIRKFHEAQFVDSTLSVETMPGVVCSRFARPISRVGLYIPGGTAVLPSTALMLGIPAQVAGCHEVVLATPPRSDGSISPEVMYVAKLVGASAILKAGGAQAIAALAYGTETVPKVDKIFGPGNQWVTAAKMLVQNDTDALVSIDMPAGPSEVLVIADYTSNPSFVAADLLSQAEHGIDSQVVLVAIALSESQIQAIEDEVDKQANSLSRVAILRESVAKSMIVRAKSVEAGIKFSNDYAPEHLILHLDKAETWVPQIQNAGSIFVGPYTPESCGDYASGTNHTLPTNGYAKQFSGVNTQSFQKFITAQTITEAGLKLLGPTVTTLADCEGLAAHANAVHVRLNTAK